ncbi:Uncharacterised protein [Klebsiella variicola]|uniref:Uncharacterized protein n=1 Tax=Klebsiella variicola TaxID=244366 RepID=A0ABD7PDQ8_KLEVA|nr:Uncharacterised protein [Klebsiella variicola]
MAFTENLAASRDQRYQHLACQPRERTAILERNPTCKLNYTSTSFSVRLR